LPVEESIERPRCSSCWHGSCNCSRAAAHLWNELTRGRRSRVYV